MKKPLQIYVPLLLCALFCIPTTLFSFHIVGGELTYECIGNNQYKLLLTVFRDCNGEGAPLDNPAYIFIYQGNGESYDDLTIPLENTVLVDPPDDICLETLPDVCVSKGTYKATVSLPPNSTGYSLVYQRYSRNITLKNIVLPEETGSSYTTEIPPSNLATCNSSPVFDAFPPIVICNNIPFSVDQSATDSDGDSLVYELCDPLIGGNADCPQPGNADNCGDEEFMTPPAPPYEAVNWLPTYDANYPIDANPAITIDPVSGRLSGKPNQLGQYVVGICVTEYRDGVAINSIRRDFQFNVEPCESVQAAVESDEITATGEFLITDCNENFEVQFVNTSLNAVSYQWDFGDPTSVTDFSTEANPFYAYPDSGQYVITLIATSDLVSCADTATILLNLYPTLTSDFTYTADCAYNPTIFTDNSISTYGEIISWYWNFGDGTTSTEQNPTHTYGTGSTYNVSLTTTTNLGCEATTTKTVNVLPTPDATFTTTILCLAIPIEFTALNNSSAQIATWSWDFGDPNNSTSTLENPTFTYPEIGTYTASLQVVSTDGCIANYQQTFTIYPTFEITVSEDKEICLGDTIELNSATIDSFTYYNYAWSPAQSLNNIQAANPLANPTENTTYTIAITDPNGCGEEEEVNIIVNRLPNVILSGDTTICLGESTPILGMIDSTVVEISWTSSTLENFGTSTPELVVLPDTFTTYFLTAIDNKGCKNVDSINIDVIQPVEADAGIDEAICQQEQVQLSALGGTDFIWTPAESLDDPTIANPIASPDTTTTYILQTGNACFNNGDTITVVVHPLPNVDAGGDKNINIGESIVLDGTTNALNYEWTTTESLTNPTSLTPTVNPLDTTSYELIVTDEQGCQNKDEVKVNVSFIVETLVPTAFSPNDDNINDVFKIAHTKGIKDITSFQVYNRWGELVFETTDEKKGWNGLYKNHPVPVGVYVFYIKGTTYLDTPFDFKGNVTVIR